MGAARKRRPAKDRRQPPPHVGTQRSTKQSSRLGAGVRHVRRSGDRDMAEDRPKHSPLGGSGAERWMNCPGSAVLLRQLHLPPSDESDYAIEGIAAHEAAAILVTNNSDAWELVGEKFYKDTEVTPDMARHLQMYVDYVRPYRTDPATSWWVEYRISGDFHPLFYGQLDFAAYKPAVLRVTDYKHGEGIAVDAEENAQMKYYAYGMLQNPILSETREVTLAIVQPRAYHPDGPIREWTTTADEIAEWGEKELIPAMQAAEVDGTLTPGPWCRFCPAKLVCPVLKALYRAAATANPKDIAQLTDDQAGRDYELREAVKFYLKAQEDDMMRRLLSGRSVPQAKLVYKKADRVWKPGAEQALKTLAGRTEVFSPEDIYSKPELKSPSQIEALGKAAKELVKEFAFKPQTGYTVALATDKRMAVNREDPKNTFSDALKKLDLVDE